MPFVSMYIMWICTCWIDIFHLFIWRHRDVIKRTSKDFKLTTPIQKTTLDWNRLYSHSQISIYQPLIIYLSDQNEMINKKTLDLDTVYNHQKMTISIFSNPNIPAIKHSFTCIWSKRNDKHTWPMSIMISDILGATGTLRLVSSNWPVFSLGLGVT